MALTEEGLSTVRKLSALLKALPAWVCQHPDFMPLVTQWRANPENPAPLRAFIREMAQVADNQAAELKAQAQRMRDACQ